MSALTPGPDHAATPQPFWESGPFRTTVQGVAIDVLLAICLLIVTSLSSDSVDWWWLLVALGKTFLMAIASSIMKRVRPRQVPDQAA